MQVQRRRASGRKAEGGRVARQVVRGHREGPACTPTLGAQLWEGKVRQQERRQPPRGMPAALHAARSTLHIEYLHIENSHVEYVHIEYRILNTSSVQ
eukprot:366080-Chlamydomonas_euryale.AAC.4